VFTTKVEPHYDDLPEDRYHFPRAYLRQVEVTVGDWIIYYEPRRTSADLQSRGGRQSYFATAHVQRIAPDPRREDHFYAYVTDYLEFDRAVPFKDGELYYEQGLRRSDGGTSKGAFGRAVRTITDLEYDIILKSGFVRTLVESGLKSAESSSSLGFDEDAKPFERPIIEMVVARPFRDAAFAVAVKTAYSNTCAMSGLQIVNGGGRALRTFGPWLRAAQILCGMALPCRARSIGCSTGALSRSMMISQFWQLPVICLPQLQGCFAQIVN
jgi:putative restriction endonuclease